jgi:aminomethyltransferase
MAQPTSTPLKRTPLHDEHLALGARMVPFAGWEMPVEYAGVTPEHLAVRTRAGLFDVSHMGEIEVAGTDALATLQQLTSNDVAKLQIGQAQYGGLLTPEGTFVDDLLVYRLADTHYLLVVNASNTAKDYRWILDHLNPEQDVVAINSSSRYGLLAVQGPAALEVAQSLTAVDLASIRYYWFATGEVAGVRATISRTGYTGEDGFEIFVPPQAAPAVWRAILEAGRQVDLQPAGLGARDTLRLEAGMRLHGQDIDETTTVLEADLAWIVGWTKEAFIGSDILHRQKAEGVSRKLVGFELVDRGIARHGHEVYADGVKAGHVTSGTQTPFLRKAIGMAYLPAEQAMSGREFEIDVRGRRLQARVVPMPFYKRHARERRGA